MNQNHPKAKQIQTDNEYISDRIKESIDIFGSQPERFGTILMNTVTVLAMLISKALQKARKLSAKLFDTGQIQPQMPVQEPVRQPTEKETPAKPVMPAETAAYPKLFKIYKELKRQNEIMVTKPSKETDIQVQKISRSNDRGAR